MATTSPQVHMKTPGLEAISFAVPKYYIDMKDLAEARNTDPAKYIKGLGQEQMAVATPCEDTVTLASQAGARLLKDYGIDPSTIGLLVVGTETSVDHSKPVSIFVHEALGLSQECRVVEMKHACYGAMAGMSMAVDWVLSGRSDGRKALIIASDIARYGVNTPGEPTQGAGAVALVVSDQPKLLEFETSYQGYYAKQVMDFWRPLYSKEAFADGHFSIQCYLDALAGSFDMYRRTYEKSTSQNSADLFNSFSASLYHVPFVKMAQKAHFHLYAKEKGVAMEKGDENWQAAQADFGERVGSYLRLNSQVGNIYTGSLFLSLLNFLSVVEAPKDEPKVMSLFGYGSGCGAEFMSAKVISDCRDWVDTAAILEQREKITVGRYEEILAAGQKADLSGDSADVCRPDLWQVDGGFLYLGTQDHKRQYQLR